MDDDSQSKNLEVDPIKEDLHNMFNVRNVFQSIWVRCTIQDDDGLDRFLLDYGCNFLWYCGSVFWFIYLLQ
jgi:hypothetical protein